MERTVFSGSTGQHSVQVEEKGSLRILRFGTDAKQSCIDLREPWKLQLDYTRWMVTALLLHPAPSRFLLFGLGGGALPHFLLRHHPGARIDVVEKEALIIRLAQTHFQLPGHPFLRLIHQDGATFLSATDTAAAYHVAFLDIFGPDSMAPDLFQPDMYRSVLKRLNPLGVLAVNIWSGDRGQFRKALAAAEEGGNGKLLCLRMQQRGNVILLLFPGEIPWARIRSVSKNALPYQRRYGFDFSFCLKKLRRYKRFSPFIPFSFS